MEILIDEEYQISSDERNFILQKKRIITGEKTVAGKKVNPDNIGKVAVDDIGYYRNLKTALNGYVRIKTLKSKAKSFEDLFKLLDKIDSTIGKIKDVDCVESKSNKKVMK